MVKFYFNSKIAFNFRMITHKGRDVLRIFSFCNLSILFLLVILNSIFFASYISYSTTIDDNILIKELNFKFVKIFSPQTDMLNSTQIFQPEGIITDIQGNLYVNDIQSDEIKKYDKNGNFITAWRNLTINNYSLNHPHSSEID
ncbi:MAG: hypothetical protein M3Y25_05810 [Thermoproteota archaeon]|nr:hypothetical protein [Thermoproteota archaeon]